MPPPWMENTQGSAPSASTARCTRTGTGGSPGTTCSVRTTESDSGGAGADWRMVGSVSGVSVKPKPATASAISGSRACGALIRRNVSSGP
jgi:hypothetical protein